MTEDKQKKLDELKQKLKDLKSRDPSHCSDTRTHVPHTIPPTLWQEIEDLEDEIKKLEAELGG